MNIFIIFTYTLFFHIVFWVGLVDLAFGDFIGYDPNSIYWEINLGNCHFFYFSNYIVNVFIDIQKVNIIFSISLELHGMLNEFIFNNSWVLPFLKSRGLGYLSFFVFGNTIQG